MDAVATIQPLELAEIIRCKSEKVLIVDARTFCEYNTSHIITAVNVWSSKIRKKRLQQNSISVYDFLQQACHISLQEMNFDEVVVYDQSATFPLSVPPDTFLYVLLLKLSSSFNKVFLLQGGFLEFQSQFYEMCEDSSQKSFLLTSLSQPCLPVTNTGPTKILPFLFLGSQHDANNKQLLLEHNISYELNVSTSCPKPDFLQDSHFFRISVNDNFSARLLPHFGEAFRFIDKVREIGGRVLVHCLAGISRSPTVVISYVMKYLHLHYDEAYRYVKTRRPNISPNINFVGQLLELDLLLFGNRVLFRSPPGSIYLDYERDASPKSSPPSGNSLLPKSSSSPCIESGNDSDFPFHRNRSLPSLRLNKSGEEVPSVSSHYSLLSPSSELASILSSFGVCDAPRKYVSDRLPSSPVLHPESPLYSSSSSSSSSSPPIFEDEGQECPASPPTRDMEFENESRRKNKPTSDQEVTNGNNEVTTEDDHKRESRNAAYLLASDRNLTTVASINLNCRCDASNNTRVQLNAPLETTRERQQQPRIMEGHSKDSTPTADKAEVPITPKEEEKHLLLEETSKPLKGDKSTTESTLKSDETDNVEQPCHSKPISVPQIVPLKKECTSSDSNNNSNCTQDGALSSFLPKTLRITSQRKLDPPYLPRSHSSSETYLNTRKRLERQAAANSGGTHTRKSFSSDEVGRGFQSAYPPPLGSHKEPYTITLELARCDSWSTSGLGSEISDWDSIQDDAQSVLMEDTQGPFDAVFSEVFPGEGQNSVLRDSFKKQTENMTKTKEGQDKLEGKKSYPQEKKDSSDTLHNNAFSSSLKTSRIPSSEDLIGTCPTPRPVSLPGVSGTYNMTDSNVSADMGVELEDSADWQKDDVEIFNFSPLCERRKRVIIEHPPVNPRTMGEDVKYIMTWYKIDSCPQQAMASETNSSSDCLSHLEKESDKHHQINKVKSDTDDLKHLSTSCQVSIRDDKEKIPLASDCPESSTNHDHDTQKESTPVDNEPSFSFRLNDKEKGASLQERWQWWDNEFKKKIRNIKKNVSLAAWDPSSEDDWHEEDEEGGASDNMAGFHLAEELMQSMEDLLEREICDIKRQASALSSRFGLPVKSVKTDAPSKLSTRSDIPSPLYSCDTRQLRTSNNGKNEISRTSVREVSTEPDLPPKKSCFMPHECPEYPECPTNSFNKENGLKVPFVLNAESQSSARAKSEPPLCMEENLYRVKSCPGIAQGKGVEDIKPIPKGADITFRFPRLFLSRNGNSKRYSCSALDFLPPKRPSFESCPDMSQLNPFSMDPGSGSTGASASSSSSFNRLLKVS